MNGDSLRISKYDVIDHLNGLSNIIMESSLSGDERNNLLNEVKRTKELVNNI